MNKRVYGVLGIAAIMANWNADFSGYPKTTSDGSTFGSDKAFKYPMKKKWDNEGEKVIYIKSMRIGTKKEKKQESIVLVPRSLKERYEQLFNVEDLKKCNDSTQVVKNLFSAIDVKNFGATFAEEGNNISITGAVQIGQGFNLYKDTCPQEQQILSPFRDPTKDSQAKDGQGGEEDKNERTATTLGTKIVSDEAHYFYPFTITPKAYKEYVEMGLTDGYTEEDYKKFKEAALVATTSYATNSKVGCENEFGLFVETDEDVYLANLSQYITFEKGEDKNIITITCDGLLNDIKDKIQNVEIYINPYTTELKQNIEGAKIFNICTQKEV